MVTPQTHETQEGFTRLEDEFWGNWLNAMPAWRRHRVFKQELQLYDQWVAGQVSLLDIMQMLDAEEGR